MTRISAAFILAGAFFSGPALAEETLVTPQDNIAPTLTVEQPVAPVASRPGGPIIQSISVRLGDHIGNVVSQIIPDFHFIAPNGNAVLLHREIVKTSAGPFNINPNAPINTPADVQKNGAVFSGGWRCGGAPYYVTLRAYIMDTDGNHSNEVQYTIHCNGG